MKCMLCYAYDANVTMKALIYWSIGKLGYDTNNPLMRRLMSGRGYVSLGHTVFRSVKSTHMCHLLWAFHTRTTLANQVKYFVFMMNSTLYSFPASSSMAVLFSLLTFCFLCTTSLEAGWMASLWLTTFGVYPRHVGWSLDEQVDVLNKLTTNSRSSSLQSEVPIFMTWCKKEFIWTSFRSSVGTSLSASTSTIMSQHSKLVFGTSERVTLTRVSSL